MLITASEPHLEQLQVSERLAVLRSDPWPTTRSYSQLTSECGMTLMQERWLHKKGQWAAHGTRLLSLSELAVAIVDHHNAFRRGLLDDSHRPLDLCYRQRRPIGIAAGALHQGHSCVCQWMQTATSRSNHTRYPLHARQCQHAPATKHSLEVVMMAGC